MIATRISHILVSTLACFILFIELSNGQTTESLVAILGIALVFAGNGYWVWPIGFGLVFMGQNSSFYQHAYFEIFLLSSLASLSIAEMFLQSRKNAMAHIPITAIWILTGALVLLITYGSLGAVHPFLLDCKHSSLTTCISEALVAGFGQDSKPLKTALVWWLGLSLSFHLSSDSKAQKNIISSLIIAGCFVIIAGIRHFKGLEWLGTICGDGYYCRTFFQSHLHKRASSTFGNPGWYGQFLIFLIPFLSYSSIKYFYQKNNFKGLILAAISVLGIIEAIYTAQRATWFAVISMITLMLFFSAHHGKNHKNKKIRSNIFSICISAIIAFTSGVLYVSISSPELIAPKLKLNLGERLDVWMSAYQIIGDNFWLGVGTSGYSKASQIYLNKNPDAFTVLETAHNTFVNIFVENGLFGLLFFILSVLAVLYTITRLPNLERSIAAIIFTGIAMNSLAQYIFYNQAIHYLYFIFLSFVISHYLSKHQMKKLENPKSDTKTRVLSSSIPLTFIISGSILGVIRPPFTATGCYPRETSDSGLMYRWCKDRAIFYFPQVKDGLTFKIDIPFTESASSIFEIDKNNIVKRRHVATDTKSLIIDIARAPNHGPQDLKVILKAKTAKFMDDHRKLSFRYFEKIQHNQLPIIVLNGREPRAKTTEFTVNAKSHFLVPVDNLCKKPKLMIKLQEQNKTNTLVKTTTIHWSNNYLSGETILSNNMHSSIPMTSGEVNNINTYLSKDNKGSQENIFQIASIKCQPSS